MSRIFDVRTPHGLVTIMVALTLTAAACSSGENTETAEVASLQSDAGSDLGDAADAATLSNAEAEAAADLGADEVALEFSQCMRDEGLDFPDLSVDANGDIDLRAGFQSVDPGADGFREAMETCGSLLEGTAFGGGRGAAFESSEFQDGLLAFSECVRDEGYDVGDLTLGGQPGGGPDGGGQDGDPTPGDGSGAGGQGGERQGGFGNRGARFAENLGLDYEDPAVAETIDGCMPIVDEAFAGFGPQGTSTSTETNDS